MHPISTRVNYNHEGYKEYRSQFRRKYYIHTVSIDSYSVITQVS